MESTHFADRMTGVLKRAHIKFWIFVIPVVLASCSMTGEDDWNTYRHDINRSGVTSATVKPPLSLHWKFVPTHPPKSAWYKPSEELPRMHFDNAHHVSVANGIAYFGSTVDNKLYALDAASGDERWSFFAEGPIRFAPSVWSGRVYFGSDDGKVYCLQAKSGKLVWKYRPGPSDKKVIGNGRLSSLWPVRTSVLVDDGVVYLGAGVFPYEGLYICALGASDGRVIWKNDGVGDKAHELKYGGITPHGYLLASDDILYVPSGRAMPAAFDRHSGQFLYVLSPGAKVGGSWGLIMDNEIIAGVDLSGTPAKIAYDTETGQREGDAFATFNGVDLAMTKDFAYTLTREGINAINRGKFQTINQQLKTRIAEQKDLRGKLFGFSRRLLESSDAEKSDIQNQIEATSKRLDNIGGETDSLKQATCDWTFTKENLNSLILAGEIVFAGGDGFVVAVDAKTGAERWSEGINGSALGLAAADGRLYVSTDQGPIYCFSESTGKAAREIKQPINNSPYSADRYADLYGSAAENILKQTGVKLGYCLVLDCGEGHLAYELAKRSELKIVGIETNGEKLAIARQKLDEAGLYGSRVVVENWGVNDLPDYFANLIVSDGMVLSGKLEHDVDGIYRLLKPKGGVICLGQSEASSQGDEKINTANIVELLKGFNGDEPRVSKENGVWVMFTRGGLEGAGGWTHLYGNPQNTSCSDDLHVKAPLGVLWYGEPGPDRMVERHARAMSPVALDGRLFLQGENVVEAYDSYNGTLLWKREIPGAVRVRVDVDGGNLAVSENGLFVAAFDKCHQLDPATGETLRVYNLPSAYQQNHRWGYVACIDNTLYGSAAKPTNQAYNEIWNLLADENGKWKSKDQIPAEYSVVYDHYIESQYPLPDRNAEFAFQRDGTKWRFIADFPEWSGGIHGQLPPTKNLMASDALFAIDLSTAKTKWVRNGRRLSNIGIAIGDGVAYYLETDISKQQRQQAFRETQYLVRKGIWEESEQKVIEEDADVRMLVAVDAETGKELWQKPIDLTGCGGDAVAAAYQDHVLLFFISAGLHDKWRFPAGQLTWHRITAVSTLSHEIIWSRPLNYMVRPVIVGDTVIIEPRACDLHTGKIKTRSHPITGQTVPWEYYRPGHTCAVSSASENCLFYRSYNAAFYDLSRDGGITYFGAVRPGCWINMIPANGLLLFPEASAGCTCSFPLRCTVVMQPQQKEVGEWSVFVAHGPMTPAKHLAINLGAPGDRRDDRGTVWFGYPRPNTDYGVKFSLAEEVLPNMGYFASDVRTADVEASDRSWLFSSGCFGLTKCKVPLIDDSWGELPGVYTVRLGFTAPTGDRKGQRVFDVKIQGKTVLEDFDIVAVAGDVDRAVIKEFPSIEVESELVIEMVSKKSAPRITEAPVINWIQAVREDNVEIPPVIEAPKLRSKQANDLLRAAKAAFDSRDSDTALTFYHQVFDGAPTDEIKQRAMEGMALVGSRKSLNRIAPYCKNPAPILWNYRGPNDALKNSAIQVHVAIAKNIARTDEPMAVKMLYRALQNAATFSLRQQIVENLEALNIDIGAEAAAEGFISHWHIIGPFRGKVGENLLDQENVNEPNVDLDAVFEAGGSTLRWHPYVSEAGMINLVKLFKGDKYNSIYAYAQINLPKEQDLFLKIGSDDGFKCWFNEEFVGRYDGGRSWAPDQDIFKVRAKQGVNTILLKISQLGGDWAFSARVTDTNNKLLAQM